MKNKFMRIAAVMLMLCLVTTCAISGTFAKYTTEGSATDSARVAKWGVEIVSPADASVNTTFLPAYDKDLALAAQTVVSAGGDVVAPGTTGTLAVPTITGTPEVAVEVTFAADLELEDWIVDSAIYCPIVFNVKYDSYDETFTFNTADYATIDLFEEAIEAAIAGCSDEYAAKTDLSTVSAASPVVTWTWAYSTSAENDVKDTALGDAATAATISFKITVTVDQVD